MFETTLPHNKIIFLMGPTASGKSHLAMALARHIGGEIISVDSAMIYREMDIGTAKPSAEERAQVPHHLIDIRDPSESYSAAEFRRDALQKISEIQARQKIPLLVGGTMLYFKALQKGLTTLPSADAGIRTKLNDEARDIGWEAMHARLKSIDPVSAKRIHPNDAQRIQRALEIFELTGKTLTACCEEHAIDAMPYESIDIAIAPSDRSVLHERIAKRFEEMLAQGFLDEVRALYDRGDLHRDLPSMRSVGYRQAWGYLSGEINLIQMKEQAIAATRQLAKRQLTWLRSWPNLNWFDSEKISLKQISYLLSDY